MYFSIQTSQSNQPKQKIARKNLKVIQVQKPMNDQCVINAIGAGLLL